MPIKNTYRNVSFMHDRQKLKVTQMSSNSRMNKLWYSYNEILHAQKRTVTHSTIYEFHEYNVE